MDWCVMYIGRDGKKKIETFETKEKALTFSNNVCCLDGVFTTAFFNHFIKWQRKWQIEDC